MRPPLRDVNQDSFEPNSAMEAAINAKIAVALARGFDLVNTKPTDASYPFVMAAVGLADSESDYLARQATVEMVKVEIGRAIAGALKKRLDVKREDIIPCLAAYFAAVDAGEVEPV